jgi:hypothetical protein
MCGELKETPADNAEPGNIDILGEVPMGRCEKAMSSGLMFDCGVVSIASSVVSIIERRTWSEKRKKFPHTTNMSSRTAWIILSTHSCPTSNAREM